MTFLSYLLVSIEGYTIKRCDRNPNGDGVAVYLNDSLLDKASIRDDIPKLFISEY